MNSILNYIPAPDVLPLPSHPYIFIFFLVVTLFIHFLFMNLTLGGSVMLIIAKYFAKVKGNNNYNRIAEEIGWLNTFNISLTVTTGVAPLLFLQVLYGQFFYTASVLLSWKWLFVLLAIIFAYYFYYLYKFKPLYIKFTGGKGFIFIVLATILFLYVALMLVTNTLVSMQPELWKDMYLGKVSVFSAKTLVLRFFHFLFAAIAFSGAFYMLYARIRKSYDKELSDTMYNLGKYTFLIPTLTQLIIGTWFLLSHPVNYYVNILTMVFLTMGIVMAFIPVFFILTKKENEKMVFGFTFLSVFFMVSVRRFIEIGYFSKYFNPSYLEVKPQWSIFIIFLILFVALLITLYYLFIKLKYELVKK
ncbi:hypothetical protein FHQ18_00015 [Deferribacter autotrophicus]|uniref:Uncharacterized protein n=1 Tax=Deferribacter autotrophicus TaxID=500465 RepID=A0A5A8F688_9BACT|nr:hypothetical protein [Deferribacter autotrophicus]KAA0259300.1 hypothetical protein FHQ18_00015 [Deferribacter autotrophicus]